MANQNDMDLIREHLESLKNFDIIKQRGIRNRLNEIAKWLSDNIENNIVNSDLVTSYVVRENEGDEIYQRDRIDKDKIIIEQFLNNTDMRDITVNIIEEFYNKEHPNTFTQTNGGRKPKRKTRRIKQKCKGKKKSSRRR
jgi:hypothetical protein